MTTPQTSTERPVRVLTPAQKEAARQRALASKAKRLGSGQIHFKTMIAPAVLDNLHTLTGRTGETQAQAIARLISEDLARTAAA